MKSIRNKTAQQLTTNLQSELQENYPLIAKSKYLTKLLDIDKTDGMQYEKTKTTELNQLSFREFVWVVIKDILSCANDFECLLDIDDLWQPQFVKCSPCAFPYDIISKVRSSLLIYFIVFMDKNIIFADHPNLYVHCSLFT